MITLFEFCHHVFPDLDVERLAKEGLIDLDTHGTPRLLSDAESNSAKSKRSKRKTGKDDAEVGTPPRRPAHTPRFVLPRTALNARPTRGVSLPQWAAAASAASQVSKTPFKAAREAADAIERGMARGAGATSKGTSSRRERSSSGNVEISKGTVELMQHVMGGKRATLRESPVDEAMSGDEGRSSPETLPSQPNSPPIRGIPGPSTSKDDPRRGSKESSPTKPRPMGGGIPRMNSNPESIRRGIQRMDSREWRGGIPPSFSRDSNLSLSRDGFSLQQGAPSPRRGRAPSGFVSSGKAAMRTRGRGWAAGGWMIAEYAGSARDGGGGNPAARPGRRAGERAATTEASIGARLDQLEGLLVKAFPALRESAGTAGS